jgi:phosphomannomutase
MSLMVSISGVRGIVGESLTPDVIVRFASAFAEYVGKGMIVLGRDGRSTGKTLANVASSTLLAMGRDVTAIGICPTPTVQLAVEKSDAVGGIMITASHNPVEWNGLKFIGSHGMLLDAKESAEFREIVDRPDRHYASWNDIGRHSGNDEFVRRHVEMVLGLAYISTELIRRRRFKVVVDCVNAAGGVIVPQLLRDLGCSVVEMNCDVSGVFAHEPEPIPENLRELGQRVKMEKADLGIAVDPDVDRLVIMNEEGEPFGEEYTIVSVAKLVLEKHAKAGSMAPASIVVNLSTTRAIDDVAKKHGARVLRTPVGEINVARKMKEVGAIVGGEGSGGVILPDLHYGRDAIVGIGLFLQLLAESGGTVSELRTSLPQYSIVKRKIPFANGTAEDVFRQIGEMANADVHTSDGLRIDFPDSWIHIRKSNTEPIVRIIAEAPSRAAAEELALRFQNAVLSVTA